MVVDEISMRPVFQTQVTWVLRLRWAPWQRGTVFSQSNAAVVALVIAKVALHYSWTISMILTVMIGLDCSLLPTQPYERNLYITFTACGKKRPL